MPLDLPPGPPLEPPYDPQPILTAVYTQLADKLPASNAKVVALNLIDQAKNILANGSN